MILKLFPAELDNTTKHILSFIPSESNFHKEVTNRAVVGFLKDINSPVSPENIVYNPSFISMFHKIVKDTFIDSSQLKEAALKQNEGYIYIIDLRDKNYPDTKPCDIIGAFKLDEGKIIEDSYTANPNYQIISADGSFKLPDEFIRNLESAMFE